MLRQTSASETSHSIGDDPLAGSYEKRSIANSVLDQWHEAVPHRESNQTSGLQIGFRLCVTAIRSTVEHS